MPTSISNSWLFSYRIPLEKKPTGAGIEVDFCTWTLISTSWKLLWFPFLCFVIECDYVIFLCNSRSKKTHGKNLPGNSHWHWRDVLRKGLFPNTFYDAERYEKYSFSYTSHLWRSIGKGVLYKTFDVKVQVHSVPELWRQTFCKVLLFLWNDTFYYYRKSTVFY